MTLRNRITARYKVVGERQQELVQYLATDNVAKPMGPRRLITKLDPGVYQILETMEGPVFEKQNITTDELLRFEDPVHDSILGELDTFWGQKENYENRGFLHNRAILMFGPPGSGKSCIIKLATQDLVGKGDVVFMAKNTYGLVNGLKAFREVEPERKCLVILEDVDEFSEHALLQLLDGGDSVDNIIYLGTTNYIERLPDRVLRPGRFDRKIEVPYPPASGRKAYLMQKAGDDLAPEDLEAIVQATDGFSFGHLREFVTSVFCRNEPIADTIARLRGNGLEIANLNPAVPGPAYTRDAPKARPVEMEQPASDEPALAKKSFRMKLKSA